MKATQSGRILLVDADPNLLHPLSILLRTNGYEVAAVGNDAAALQMLPLFQPDIAITELLIDGLGGLRLVEELRQRRPGLPVLLMAANGTIPDAVAATTQRGAFDFLTKPVNGEELLEQVAKALRLAGSDQPDESWRADIVACSPAMETLLDQAQMVADSEVSVLISGDTGTGKELLARAIHKASARRDRDFVAVNCGAIPEQLLETELFGHAKGAFTSAVSRHRGLLQTADGGTLLLDEIGDMPRCLQVKLLRVLQDKSVRPVGSTAMIPVDVRVISATHRDLQQAMAAGAFREDLYYRLNVFNLHIPPLNERREDIPLLVNHILRQLVERRDGLSKVYTQEAMELLVAADWPGNVRQLNNVVEQNVALCPGSVIGPQLVKHALGSSVSRLPSYNEARREFTRNYLVQLLRITQGNVSQAARLAKRNRTNFHKLLAEHQLESSHFKNR